MAIISEIMSRIGIACNYSRIESYDENRKNITIMLRCYMSKEAMESGATWIHFRTFTIPKYSEGYLNQTGMNHLKYCYIKLCEAYGFTGDEDISQWVTNPILPEEEIQE